MKINEGCFRAAYFFEENFVLSEKESEIPIKPGLYSEINLNSSPDDSEDMKKYKVLLNIEYSFCIKIIDSVIQKASVLYDKQISTGKILNFCCDFRLLEEKSREYSAK